VGRKGGEGMKEEKRRGGKGREEEEGKFRPTVVFKSRRLCAGIESFQSLRKCSL